MFLISFSNLESKDHNFNQSQKKTNRRSPTLQSHPANPRPILQANGFEIKSALGFEIASPEVIVLVLVCVG